MNSNYGGATGEIPHSQQEQFECLAMAASSNSWLHQNLLPPQHSSQQPSLTTHSLFHHAELPLHSSPPLQHMNLHHGGGHGMDSHPSLHHSLQHPALHLPGDLQPLPQLPLLPVQGTGNSGRAVNSNENGDAASVRKVHKADREKLRRDRLNEQFVELAAVLDPDRPKNDKATILGDSVQVVKELRSDVKRLKSEQATLLDESRDLQQEKTELREEKAALKTETEQLQSQLQQRLRGMLPWISMDPTAALMGAAPYPYPAMPVPPPPPAAAAPPQPPQAQPAPASTPPPPPPPTAAAAAATEAAPAVPATSQAPPAVVGPSPFLSLAPPGVHYMHPAYAMYGARPPEGGHPHPAHPAHPAYMPYPPPYGPANHSHVERPYAQYPSPMPGYLVQMQPPPTPPPGFRPPYGMALVRPPYPAPKLPSAASPEPQGVETSLQLQTPGGGGGGGGSSRSPPAPASETIPSLSKTAAQGADLELTPPGTKEATITGGGDSECSKVESNNVINGGDSIQAALSLASKPFPQTTGTTVTLPSGGGASEPSESLQPKAHEPTTEA